MGLAPLRRSAEALPIACDASNARTMAVRKYHYVFCALSPAGCYPCFTAWYFSLASLLRERSWRTHRMARHKRNVSDLPYAASPFYCAAFFVKEQRAVLRYGTEKGEAFQYRVALFSPKCEDSKQSWTVSMQLRVCPGPAAASTTALWRASGGFSNLKCTTSSNFIPSRN